MFGSRLRRLLPGARRECVDQPTIRIEPNLPGDHPMFNPDP